MNADAWHGLRPRTLESMHTQALQDRPRHRLATSAAEPICRNCRCTLFVEDGHEFDPETDSGRQQLEITCLSLCATDWEGHFDVPECGGRSESNRTKDGI